MSNDGKKSFACMLTILPLRPFCFRGKHWNPIFTSYMFVSLLTYNMWRNYWIVYLRCIRRPYSQLIFTISMAHSSCNRGLMWADCGVGIASRTDGQTSTDFREIWSSAGAPYGWAEGCGGASIISQTPLTITLVRRPIHQRATVVRTSTFGLWAERTHYVGGSCSSGGTM